MRVRTKVVPNQKYSGYYDHKRRVAGEVFILKAITKIGKDGKKVIIAPENQFSERWMEKVDKDAPPPKPIEQPAPEEIQGDDVI
jgi:hypothetical protein